MGLVKQKFGVGKSFSGRDFYYIKGFTSRRMLIHMNGKMAVDTGVQAQALCTNGKWEMGLAVAPDTL